MGEAVRNPDRALVDRIRALEAVVATQQRLPSGANSIGWGYVPLEAPRGVSGSGYAQVTASQTGITTETDLTGLSVTVTVAASRRIKISVTAIITQTVIESISVLRMKEGSTNLGLLQAAPSNTNGETYSGFVVITPTAGSHTYKLTLSLVGSGTTGIAASAGAPANILVEDIGSA